MKKAILVALQTKNTSIVDINSSLDELSRLCLTDNISTAAALIQKRELPDPAFFIGQGKALEIGDLVKKFNADVVIFDNPLKPTQQRNLEKVIGVPTMDRIRVILNIFAMRARTREGKLQVERAELSYWLSRLASQGVNLDSQTGGIGTRRGPGEKKIENDKRKLRDEIAKLDRGIAKIKERRDIQRHKRSLSDLPEVAIVGYTNAGKSTLLKALSNSEIYIDDKLFATLDPLTRKIRLAGGRMVLFTDTVGFINNLPHDLVAAFRATMEEILRAKCVLHIVDASSPSMQKQMETVVEVIKDIGAGSIPLITVYNKADKIEDFWKKTLKNKNSCVISAKDNSGIDELLKSVEKIVQPKHVKHLVKLEYGRQDLLDVIYKLANVKAKTYQKENIELEIETSAANWQKIQTILTRPK
ncbi:MAG: GTPase HflX [Elusimicrobiota bacterium]|jgi:GTP-binding protein HflX|nr:GTPase HflX [Elusimicrobiota bacterium]